MKVSASARKRMKKYKHCDEDDGDGAEGGGAGGTGRCACVFLDLLQAEFQSQSIARFPIGSQVSDRQSGFRSTIKFPIGS